MPIDLSLHYNDNQAEDADRYQDFVASIIVGCVVCAVDLGANERINLHNHVVDHSCNGAFLDV